MELPEKILAVLADVKSIDTLQLAQNFNEDHQKIIGAVKSLESLGDVVKTETKSIKKFELTKEGEEVAQRGSHEALVYANVPAEGGIAQPELMKNLANSLGAAAKVGFSKAMSSGWLAIDKSSGQPKIVRKVATVNDEVQKQLVLVTKGQGDTLPEKTRDDFKKRKLLQEAVVKYYELSQGDNFTTTIQKPETELTPEMIANGSWKTANFKPYNFEALGIQPHRGHLHPLLKVRAEYRQIFLEMGFSEMPTNNFIESSFWNFDALFQPQQHPARDAHDTFFISDPADAGGFPPDYLERVTPHYYRGTAVLHNLLKAKSLFLFRISVPFNSLITFFHFFVLKMSSKY
jgi:phenylalanyl-tRNA synthetase alpha chain